jgi:hypothetical protein
MIMVGIENDSVFSPLLREANWEDMELADEDEVQA